MHADSYCSNEAKTEPKKKKSVSKLHSLAMTYLAHNTWFICATGVRMSISFKAHMYSCVNKTWEIVIAIAGPPTVQFR